MIADGIQRRKAKLPAYMYIYFDIVSLGKKGLKKSQQKAFPTKNGNCSSSRLLACLSYLFSEE